MRGEFIFKSCLFGLMVLGSRRLKIMGLASWPLVAMCFFQLGEQGRDKSGPTDRTQS